MVTVLSKLAGPFFELLFPLHCVVCKREGAFICGPCEPAFPRLQHPYCSICAAPGMEPLCYLCSTATPAIDRIGAPYLMAGPVSDLVHELKYRNLRAEAPTRGKLLAN